MHPRLERRPIVVALAGPNGAGKSTFFNIHLRSAGLRSVNADDLKKELNVDDVEAARMANALRVQLVHDRESFIFETVFSDPVQDKLNFLKDTATRGYEVALLFVGIPSPAVSETRVQMRVTQGGHDVRTEKIHARYPRSMTNLALALPQLPLVLVYDNSNLVFRQIAVFEDGQLISHPPLIPDWFRPLLAPHLPSSGM